MQKMEKSIEKGFGFVDSILATYDRMMATFDRMREKLDRIDELLTIRLGKMKPHYSNTTTSPVLHRQDSTKAATPLPALPPLPTATLLPKPPVPAKTLLPVTATTLLPPPLPSVSMTTQPPVPLKMQEPRPPVSVTTPSSLADAVVLVASAPPDTTVVVSLSTGFFPPSPLPTKAPAPARVAVSFPHRNWKELTEFFNSGNLCRKYTVCSGINVQQGEYGFTHPNSLKMWQIWDVF
ncbi:hypothetical protein OROGR_029760 [Orobanche gracilis]